MADYISREAALALAREGRLVSNSNFKSVCDAINSIPAADVVPVVRGKWIQRKSWTRCVCSACSWEITFVTGNSYNYCPNCGADMREES